MNLRRNTIWNLAGSAIPLIPAAIFIPYLLSHLGNQSFGLLTLIWATIGYFSLFDMGVGRALTYQLSKIRSTGSYSEISQTLRAGLLLTLGAGIAGAVLLYLIANALALSWLKISPDLQQDALLSFKIAAIGVIPTTITSGLRGAQEGLGQFSASNLNRIVIGCCMFLLPPLSIMIHGSHLWIITLYLIIARVIVAIVAIIQLRTYLFTSSADYSKEHLSSLLNYGVWITVTGIIGPMMVYGDRFFVSAAIGASLLPFYAIPQEGLQRLLIIPGAISGALLPQMTTLDKQSMVDIYKRCYKRVAILMFGICLFASLFAYPVLSWWISIKFAQTALPVTIILSLGIWLNSIASIPYTLLHANGNPRLTAVFHLLELVFYAFILWFLAKNFGLKGAASAWVIRVSIDLILLNISANRLIKATYENT